MHSKIFQITTMRVSGENRLNENTLECGDGHYYDYCAEISAEERKYHIDNLVNHVLPKGMFELVSDDIIRYNGGADEWKADFVSAIQQKANAVTPGNCMMFIGEVYQLEQFLKNPLDTSYHFYTDELSLSGSAYQSYDFLQFVFGLESGTLLYIGGVIDYHF